MEKHSNPTSKPNVTKTPNLACGLVVTKFFRKMFWRDDIIRVTSWPWCNNDFILFNDIRGGWNFAHKFVFLKLNHKMSMSKWLRHKIVLLFYISTKPVQIIMCKNCIEKLRKFENFKLKSFVLCFFVTKQKFKKISPFMIEIEYYSCMLLMIPTIMLLMALKLNKKKNFATNIKKSIWTK